MKIIRTVKEEASASHLFFGCRMRAGCEGKKGMEFPELNRSEDFHFPNRQSVIFRTVTNLGLLAVIGRSRSFFHFLRSDKFPD